MELGVVEIILMTSLVNSAFFLGLTYLKPKKNNRANRILTLFIFLTSLNFASWILVPYLAFNYDWFCLDRFPVIYFLGPCIYVFSLSLFGNKENGRVSPAIYAGGALDILVTTVLWMYIYFFELVSKFEILFDPLTLHIYEGLAIIYNGTYLYRAIRLSLRGASRFPRLVHVFVIIVIIFFLWIGFFMADVSVFPSQLPDTAFYPLWLLMLYLNLYLGYHFIINPVKSITYLTGASQPTSLEMLELAKRLTQLMKEEKAYRKPDLSQSFVATQMNISSTALTALLKNYFKCNYYDFINEYRVLETMKRFETGEDRLYTIKTIAEEAGFRSKTTFIKAFKKKTGMLPKEFISSTQPESSSTEL